MPKNHKFSIQYFYGVKKQKKGECSAPFWSFNILSILMRASNCVRFCLNPFCREIKTIQIQVSVKGFICIKVCVVWRW